MKGGEKMKKRKITKYRPYLSREPFYVSYSRKEQGLKQVRKLKKDFPREKVTLRKEKYNKWIIK
jgi:hypothetical protein